MISVTVCVGSSCHVKGARNVIMQFNDLVKKHALEKKIELKGSFCMERCGEGINWKIENEDLTSSTVENAVQVFEERVIKPLLRE